MIPLLKGVAVLLLTLCTARGTSLYYESCQDEESYLNSMMNLTACLGTFSLNQTYLRDFLNGLLSLNENLVYTLVNKTQSNSINFSLPNLEVQAFIIGPLTGYTFITRDSVVIYLYGYTQVTSGLPVVFMNYSNVADIFAPSFFDTNIISNKTLMSDVISVSLPQNSLVWFEIDITLKHTKELDPSAILSCMNWDTVEWPCYISWTTSNYTVCYCFSGTTFAVISETDPCMNNWTEDCIEGYLFRMLYYIYFIDQLSYETAINYLNITLNLMLNGKKHSEVNGSTMDYGDILLYVHEVLLYSLETELDNDKIINISFPTLEIQGFLVGSNVTTVITSSASMDINFTSSAFMDIDFSWNNGLIPVGFLSYTTLNDVLEQTFLDPFMDSNKLITSTVVSAVAPYYYFYFQIPVTFTLKHINELDPDGILLCAQREWYLWNTGHCRVTQTNSTHTVCSCDQLETLALFMLTIPCKNNITALCANNFLDLIVHNMNQDLPEELVKRYLNITLNLMNDVKKNVSDGNDLMSFGDKFLNVTRQLVSPLMGKGDTNFTIQDLEVQVAVGQSNIMMFTDSASLDINISRISGNNSASVVFMSYSNMSDILKPTFSKTIINTNKIMISTVVSVYLNQTEDNMQLTPPVNVTFKHTDIAPISALLCVSWKKTEWVQDVCDIIDTNISHSVCSCNQLGVFALFRESDLCMNTSTVPCVENLLKKDQNSTTLLLQQKVVKRYLNMTMNLMTNVTSTTTDQSNLIYYANAVLNLTKNLVSTLVNKTDNNTISLSLPNLEVFVSVVVKPNPSSNNVSQLATTNASLDIDLIGISKNNRGSAAVAFMNYGNMADILKHSDTRKTIISSVVSATLPKTPNTWFTQPVNITFKHRELDTHGQLSCVYWNKNKWVEIGSTAIRHNSTHTICSYDDLSVFALIIEVVPCMTLFGVTVSLHCDSVLNMSVARGFGAGFLALCLLTFAFCCQTRNNNNNNTALINLCLNLLLFHLLDLLKPLFQLHLQSPQACAVTIGVRWFFFISTFVWMFIETVQLFLLVKNLSKVRSNLQHGLSWKWLNMIGYIVPVGVLIVCSVFTPLKSVNEECWDIQSMDMNFNIPILFFVASNILLFITIIIMMIITMKRLRNENLQRSNTNNSTFIMRVMFKSLAQFIILGCYWIFPLIPSENEVLYNIFLFLNSQQGTFIFIVHCLLNQEVRQQYRKFLGEMFHFQNPGTTSEFRETQETQN